VVLLRVEGVARSIEDMGDELPLGTRKDVLGAIRAVFPTAAGETPTQLIFREGDLSIEFALHGRNPVNTVTVEVRGEGDPVSPLMELARRNGWVVLDVSTSEFIDPEDPSDEGYGGYRKLAKGVARERRKK
jgi:hypothetical protein